MIDAVRPSQPVSPPALAARLTRVLVAKSVIEALFVVALALYFFYPIFNSPVHGSIEVADQHTIAGWVINKSQPGMPIEVHLYIDGHFVSRHTAHTATSNSTHSFQSGAYNFAFKTPLLAPGAEHEARVYVMRGASDGKRLLLQEIGAARQFRVTREKAMKTSAGWKGESGH
jgi:hypothetical protein